MTPACQLNDGLGGGVNRRPQPVQRAVEASTLGVGAVLDPKVEHLAETKIQRCH